MPDAFHPRFFAIVPAAGISARMGRPKLLLPWGDKTMIEAVLDAWRKSGVAHVVITVRQDNGQLAELARAAGAEVVVVSPPPADMKASVLAGLDYLERQYRPAPDDAWLLAPADMPLISPQVIRALCQAWKESGAGAEPVVAPVHEGRRGHPVLFRWALLSAVKQLAEHEGLNELSAKFAVKELAIDDPASFVDLDTPADYRRWQPPPKPRQ